MYALCVQASTRIGSGALSMAVVITTDPDSSSPPTNFTATALNSTSIRLTWGYPMSPQGLIAGYQIVGNTSLLLYPVTITISTNNTSQQTYRFGGLIPNTAYYFAVRAYSYNTRLNVSTQIYGSYSQQLVLNTLQDIPSMPINFQLSAISSTVLMGTWAPPTTPNGIITVYTIYCRVSQNQTYPEQVPTGASNYTVVNMTSQTFLYLSGLLPFTFYRCYVTANTSAGEGNTSNITISQTRQAAPSSPTNFLLSPVPGSPSALFANWTVPIPRNGIITAYTVYCNTSASQAYPEQVIGPNIPTIRSVVNRTTLAVTFNTGLNPYTQYSCYVTANTSAGEGSPSVIVTTRTVEGVPSGAPGTVASITVAPTSVNVSWNQLPNTSRNGIIIAYEVAYTWSLGTNSVNTSGAQNQLLLNMLQECVQYSISVRAYTSQGPGPYSVPVLDSSLNMYAEVPQPPEVLLSALSATSANLSWSCPLEKNYTIVSYSVNVTVNNPSSIDAGCVNGQNLTYYITVPGYQRYVLLNDTLLLPFTSYSFEVLADTTQGEGEFSIPRSFTTLQAPPTSPLNLIVNVLSYSSLLVSWNPPTCSNGIISGYMVTYTPSIGTPPSPYIVSNVTTLLLQNLLNNAQYTISLCAFTAGGCSPNISATSTTYPGPTTNPGNLFLRVSTLTNIENHRNDAALSQLQNQLYTVLTNLIPGSKPSDLGISCAAVQMCETGQYRIECRISIFLNVDVNTIMQPLSMANISVASLIPLANMESISANGFCNCERNVMSDRGTYNWPEAEPNHIDSQMCQYAVMTNITRYCNTNLTWTEDSSKCPTVVTNQFAQLNTAIKNQTINTQNVVSITAQLQTVVSQATQVVDQSTSNLAVVTAVFTQISNISAPTSPVQNTTIINVVAVLSSIQTWPPTVLNTSGSIIVQNFEKIATSFVQQINFTSLNVTNNQTTFVAQKIPLETLTTQGKSFTTVNNVQTSENTSTLNITTPPSSPPKLSASVFLPQTLFSLPTIDNTTNNTNDVGIFFTIYKTASFFPLASTPNSTTVAPLVVGVTVVGINTSVLMDPIELNFSIPNTNNTPNYTCVSWDFTAAGNEGGWTSDGCYTTQVNASNTTSTQIECKCYHLTNFAVLVDISSTIKNVPSNKLPIIVDKDLPITDIGVSLSLFGLVTTVITLLLIKKLRQKDVTKYHIQLCCALIGMLLVFVTGIDKTGNFGGCVTVSVLIHYFTLVAVMWMGAEALFMFQKIVIVFVQITTRYIVTVSLICWVTPLVPVIIPLAIDRNLLVKRTHIDNSTMGYCFISNVGVFFGAFLGPILLVLTFNMVIFIIVIVVLVRHLCIRSKELNKKAGNLQLMAYITGIAFLLGLTWLFGAFTVVNVDRAFQILFTLVSSFQGFLIFNLFCVLNSDVRLAWKVFSKRLAPQNSSTVPTKQTTLSLAQQDKSEKSESVFTEDIATLGSPAKLTHTISLNMNEVEEVTFNEIDEPSASIITEDIQTPGLVAKLTRTFSQRSHHKEEVVQLKFDEQGEGVKQLESQF